MSQLHRFTKKVLVFRLNHTFPMYFDILKPNFKKSSTYIFSPPLRSASLKKKCITIFYNVNGGKHEWIFRYDDNCEIYYKFIKPYGHWI